MNDPARVRASTGRLPGAAGVAAALLAASCCVLPLILITTGLAGASIMMAMMRYEWLTLPIGTVGLLIAWAIHFRQRRRCEAQACHYVGRRASQIQLVVATLVVAAALLLRIFPSWTAALLQSLG